MIFDGVPPAARPCHLLLVSRGVPMSNLALNLLITDTHLFQYFIYKHGDPDIPEDPQLTGNYLPPLPARGPTSRD